MQARDILPYGVGVALVLIALAAYLYVSGSDSDSTGGESPETLPDVYNVL